MRLAAALVLVGLLASALPASALPAAQPTGQGITVAVLDSGVDDNHPELAGRVERMTFQPVLPGLPIGPGSAVADPNGQGTAVASIVAGQTLGLAPQARILDLQVYTGTAIDTAAERAAIDAMDYLLSNPGRAQVVLLSFAARGVSASGAQTLAEQAHGLRTAGILVLVPSAASMSALHGHASVVTVAGIDCPAGAQQGSPTRAHKPDLVAEHVNLRAAQAATLANPVGSGMRTVSGTAYAAAQVAGTAALMLDARGDLPVDAAAALLRATAADIGEPGVDRCFGFGLLTPEAAWAAAEAWSDPLRLYPTQGTPGPGAATLAAGLALAVLARRRRA